MLERVLRTSLFCALAAGLAHAGEVTIQFAGQITSVGSSGIVNFSDDFVVGQPASGFFTIDDSVVDTDDAINVGEFINAFVDFEMVLGSGAGAYTISHAGPSAIRAADNASINSFPQGDYVTGSPVISGTPIDGAGILSANYYFYDLSNTAFPAQDPQSLTPTWDLNALPDVGFFLRWDLSARGDTTNAGFVEVGKLMFTVVAPCASADLAPPFGVLNVDDIDAFVAAFLAGDLAADCDGTGVLNVDDIDCFVSSFLAGCP